MDKHGLPFIGANHREFVGRALLDIEKLWLSNSIRVKNEEKKLKIEKI